MTIVSYPASEISHKLRLMIPASVIVCQFPGKIWKVPISKCTKATDAFSLFFQSLDTNSKEIHVPDPVWSNEQEVNSCWSWNSFISKTKALRNFQQIQKKQSNTEHGSIGKLGTWCDKLSNQKANTNRKWIENQHGLISKWGYWLTGILLMAGIEMEIDDTNRVPGWLAGWWEMNRKWPLQNIQYTQAIL